MNKKKIIYIAQSAGGVAEYLYMFLNNIEHEKYEHILILSEDYKKQIKRFENLANKIYFVPMIRKINFKSDIISVLKIRKIIKNEKPDIVYLHSSKAGAIGRIALLFNKKIEVLYNAHGWYFNAEIGNKKRKIFAIIERILAIKTDMIINISKDEYESAIKYKIANKNKMCVIENGIDFRKFNNSNQYREKIRKENKISKDEIVIGVVGRISEQKDPITAIRAFKMVHDKYNNTKLMYIGSGELEKNIIKYAKENNLKEYVIITGWVNDVENYIPAIDIAILPSKWEGFGLAIVEYMACKKPVIATKIGGIQDIICDEKKGILIEKQNYVQLYEAILKYINDKELVEKITSANYKYSYDNFNIKKVVYEHEKIFSK